MRLILFFLIIPGLLNAQSVNDNWTTPLADIKFSDTKIIYTFSNEDVACFGHIKPDHYNSKLLELKMEVGEGYLAGDEYKNLVTQLYDYLDEWHIGHASNRDKQNFLEVSAILIIWNIRRDKFLPDNTLEILGYLENDMFLEISKNAKLVLELYDYYDTK